ncbi:hypothetical protein J32TS6_31180 [Virgibacillus pantothenticus]|uniref:DUF4467 domain-containing protein n=2 Tax=Bacillaceae TaxID=186817 RepID=A0A0L0QKZ0_VIRPA|nr:MULTISPECIES: hypothetical protein [Virgibacillus]API91540.1 hypothetical protein BKP57_06620 [Virgibacillus sp. 6R]KNE19257.1 hypothetical protein AFK71_12090 [Virgibacillus pantothenticus]MBS7426946.1 hypothetical protein [Virgibacillus sp. 19R1-5]MED3735654.1 hypothetical protein [Virgibacillus pantothenticus]QTY15730.1 hypothetical protein KBP50_17965 [Virgibacillus pantothenticus]
MHKHVLKIMVLMIFSISLVACGNSEAKTNNNLTYENIVNLAIEKVESEIAERNNIEYDSSSIDYGNDLRSSSDITMWENGKYIKVVVYDKEEDDEKEITHYRLKDDELVNINGHPDIDFDSIEEQEPDYIEEKGKIIKQ